MARRPLLCLALLTVCGCGLAPADLVHTIILPEQLSIPYRDPSQFPPARLPDTPPPRTVSDTQPGTAEWRLSLDDAIRIALQNARVVRMLSGTTAVASGRTIYDAAIANTTIDQAQAVFDPALRWNNTWNRTNVPMGEFLPTGHPRPGEPAPVPESFISSTPTDAYLSDAALTKTNVLGGQWALEWTENPTRIAAPGPFPLNPESPSSVTLSYTQPLLQGAGFAVNMAPIVIARLNTEQSFFQYKDAVQELVRGVIEAYWNLVEARVVVWARKIQVQQSQEAYERESARLKTGFSDIGTMSQAEVTYKQFQANLVAAQADVLDREGALRNLLFLPPNDNRVIVPTSAPASRKLPHDWLALVGLAEQRRPDIIELKIIEEADRQRLIQAQSQALPQLNAMALYRWNGLSGEMPNEQIISTRPGQFTDWTLGINFSVPLGLRAGRALVREQRLLIARDRANIDQQLHFAVHDLAATLRELDSAYAQYLAYRETRVAADINLRVQTEKFRTGQTIYLNVLQALNDWGTAVSSEAQQLLNYNIALAALERQTGTILNTHGLVFTEERFKAAGPLLVCPRDYPEATVPVGGKPRYPGTAEPSEDAFDLRNPEPRTGRPTLGPIEPLPEPNRVK